MFYVWKSVFLGSRMLWFPPPTAHMHPGSKEEKKSLPPSLSPYLLLLLLFILLGEEGVNPPDLGEHAAVRQAEAEAEEPEAELGGNGEEKSETTGCWFQGVSDGAGAACRFLFGFVLLCW